MLKKFESPLFTYAAVIAAYTLITCVVTYPVALKMTTAMASCCPSDAEHHVWALWWAKTAVVDLHTSPANITTLFYPTGAYVPIHFTWPYAQLFSIPLISTFGPVFAYNLQVLLSFILSGFTAYLLCYHLTKSKLASFVGGCVYSFSSFHFIHAIAGHMAVAQIQWFPLYVLFMTLLLKAPRLKAALLAGVFWALSLSVYTTYAGYFGILFPVAFLAYHIWADRKAVLSARFLGYLLLSFLVSAILVAPFILPFVIELLSGKGAYLMGYGTLFCSPDVFSFFVPSPHNPIFEKVGFIRSFATQITDTWLGPGLFERIVYVGWIALALALIGARKSVRASGFWGLLGLGAAILALGPFLRVAGHVAQYNLESAESLIVMPYAILRKLPFFALDRTSGRLGVLVMLAVAVLAGYGLASILKMIPNNKTRVVMVTVLASLVVIESLVMFPFPVLDASVPPFYLQLAHDSEDYAILDIPRTSGLAMYYQIYHGHRIVGGYLQRIPVEENDHALFLSELAMRDIVQESWDEPRLLGSYGVRYVVVQKALVNDAELGFYVSHLRRALGDPVYEDDKIAAFSVPEIEGELSRASEPGVHLGDGWCEMELWNGIATRWMGNEATIYFDNETAREATLSLRLQAFHKARNLEIYVNGEEVGEFQAASQALQAYTTGPFSLQGGRNIIEFRSEAPCDSPLALKIGLDGRCLSVAVQGIELFFR